MASEVRQATEEEKGLAVKFADKFSEGRMKELIQLAEEEGFRVVPQLEVKNRLKIFGYGFILDWDFKPQSLDEVGGPLLAYMGGENAAWYVGAVAHKYLEMQGIKIPN